MQFLVSVQSPKMAGFQAAGDWLVDADNDQNALAVVQERAGSSIFPTGSTWTVNPRSEEGEPYKRAR